MSRRDTIVVAVLLNIGLLAILFLMAMTPEDPTVLNEQYQVATAPPIKVEETRTLPLPTPVVLASGNDVDEVDTVLKDFAATLEVQGVGAQTASKEQVAAAPPKQLSAVVAEELPKYVDVTVKSGDILGRIAQANGTTVGAIKQANNLTSDRLKVGQLLRIPVGVKKQKNANQTSSDIVGSSYVIQTGDNPWKIAKKFNVSVSELLRLNDLDEARARNLRPGDRIRVR